MAENNKLLEAPDDPANEQPLVSHLIELRNRTVKASIAVLVIFACLSPFMKQIFDFLSQPLMVALPQGVKLLATGVVAPFMVPLKVTLFVAFLIALPYVLYQLWAYVAPAPRASDSGLLDRDVRRGHGLLLLHRVPHGVPVHRRLLARQRELRA